MSLFNKIYCKIFGKPIATGASHLQNLSVMTGVPALGLDALASTAYGPEAALMILLPLGLAGLHYFLPITILIVVVLITLYLSYQQTIEAYPGGGGAYVVASDNLGKNIGLWAAVALLIDYLLNVAVGIAAGVGAVISLIPSLQPYILELCLLILFMLTILNLRGIRESGAVFAIPTIVFIVCIAVVLGVGIYKALMINSKPISLLSPPSFPNITESLSIWLLLGAFANGLTAMTGVEAVSNAVPLFKKPVVRNAQWTLTIIVIVLALFLLALGYLTPIYHLRAMDESEIGYRTLYSQLIASVLGEGIFYYISITSIFIVLTYSAQTSFAAFPRICRLLAEDHFMPSFFADQGRRLVYSSGIIVLAILSAILLIIFKGITNALIPLFALGAFSAFFFSQAGMVVRWYKSKQYHKLFFNALGASTTFIALIVIIFAKFLEGAWIVVVAGLGMVYVFKKINRHYHKIDQQIEHPLRLQSLKLKHPIVVIPIRTLNCITEQAIEVGMLISDEVTVVNISPIKDDEKHPLRRIWKEMVIKPGEKAHVKIPTLKIIYNPYREVYKPMLQFIKKVRKDHPKRLIAVVIPELVEPHWYEYLLHNVRAAGLRAFLFLRRDKNIVVIDSPWYIKE